MAYPSLAAYQDSVQNPRLVFRDPELARSQIEQRPNGLPKPRSGGFAITYRLSTGGNHWAVRCFHREVPDLEQRYAAISAFFTKTSSPLFVRFRYIPDGILVQGHRYPIVKMDWVNGQTLGAYIDQYAQDPRRIAKLAVNFRAAVSELERLGVSHGDLQLGNILATDSAITLIDYDGMHVPGMAMGPSNETGHVDFQSPFRDASHSGSKIDRFSAIVINLALEALCEKPDLWQRRQDKDNLLFQRLDFIDPEQSPLLRELRSITGFAHRVDQFIELCRTPLDALPRLEDVLSGTASATPSSVSPLPATALIQLRQYEVLQATEEDRMLHKVGERIEVVGHVLNVAEQRTRGGQRYAFVDFADWKTNPHAFRVVLWADVLDGFAHLASPITRIEGQWVSVLGLMERYQGRPQIVLDESSVFRLLRNKAEADAILGQAVPDVAWQPAATPPSGGTRGGTRNDAIRDAFPTPQRTPSVHKTVSRSPTRSGNAGQPVTSAPPQGQAVQTGKQLTKSKSNRRSPWLWGLLGLATLLFWYVFMSGGIGSSDESRPSVQNPVFSSETRTPTPMPAGRANCDAAYPDEHTCIRSGPPLDQPCAITDERNFTVLPPDPRGLDSDGDGVGCEPITAVFVPNAIRVDYCRSGPVYPVGTRIVVSELGLARTLYGDPVIERDGTINRIDPGTTVEIIGPLVEHGECDLWPIRYRTAAGADKEFHIDEWDLRPETPGQVAPLPPALQTLISEMEHFCLTNADYPSETVIVLARDVLVYGYTEGYGFGVGKQDPDYLVGEDVEITGPPVETGPCDMWPTNPNPDGEPGGWIPGGRSTFMSGI